MPADNKRIAKNTMVLYFRQIIVMIVGLYTSRIILQSLGVVDYGIYGIVGGVVGFMGFLNATLSTSSSRFITYALGEGDFEKSKRTFSTTLTVHVILGLLILLIGEIVGIYMIYNQLNIPEERLTSAVIAFQFSIFTTAIGVSQVPYSACMISHEDFSLVAYMAIWDVAARLLIAFGLLFYGGDKLILFAGLLFANSVGVMLFYRFYCSHKYKEAIFKLHIDNDIFRQIATFSGWNLIYQFVYTLNAEGTTVLIGMFFNPAIVAAKTISVKVNSMTTQFIGQFRAASAPLLSDVQHGLLHQHRSRACRFLPKYRRFAAPGTSLGGEVSGTFAGVAAGYCIAAGPCHAPHRPASGRERPHCRADFKRCFRSVSRRNPALEKRPRPCGHCVSWGGIFPAVSWHDAPAGSFVRMQSVLQPDREHPL